MKATLEFNLDDTEDAMAHLRCVRSLNMAMMLWEIKVNMARQLEHYAESGGEDLLGFTISYIQELFEQLNVNPEELCN